MFLLVFCVIVTVLNSYLPSFVEKVVKALVRVPKKFPIEMENLKQQMDEINMKEELAKYAKLQRQYNKLKDEFKIKVKELANQKWKYGLVARYVSQLAVTILCIVMFWNHRSTPVIILKEDWLQPVASVLAWPTQVPGALSFPVWFLICSTVLKLTKEPHSLRLQ